MHAPGTQMTEPRIEIARRIFNYWKLVTSHPRSHPGDKRLKLICDRLNDGYSEDDLILAVLGCSVSKWHQGQNPSNTKYNSIELILRNGDQVDKFMDIGIAERDRRAVKAILEKQQVQSRIEASTCGDTYKAVRGRLLSLVKPNKDSE